MNDFTTSDQPELELVRKATLRVTLATLDAGKKGSATLKVRQLLSNAAGGGVVVASAEVAAADTSQVASLDVSEAVQQWIMDEEENNLGLSLECPDCSANAGISLDGVAENAVIDVSVESKRWRRRRNKRSTSGGNSFFANALGAKRRRQRRRHRNDCRVGGGEKGNRRNRQPRCCRRRLTVDFTQLRGFEFIVEPSRLDVFVCAGRCPQRFDPATGHALLQSIVRAQSPASVPRPCCAPSRLSSHPILHVAPDGKHLEVSHWKNVVAQECKCS